MTTHSDVTLRWPMVALVAIALVAGGAGTTYLLMQRTGINQGTQAGTGATSSLATENMNRPGGVKGTPTGQPLPDVAVTLSVDAVTRAGIELAPVMVNATASAVIRIPGTIEPNAYKQVMVTPLVSGRVTRVLAELGDRVQSGQTLIQIFSPELADAQTKYLSAKAELEAHERELARASKLVAIGAASQQEIDRLHAEHSAKVAGVQSLRSRLTLLGMSAAAINALSPDKEIDATSDIAAPLTGVITERTANVGLNVEAATKLFTVVDLSSVWVVAAVHERDLSRIRVGSAASVTTAADLKNVRQGRVSYIDPQVSPETRTGRVRVELSNPNRELRLGMFADVEVAAPADRSAVMIPQTAVQNVGDRQVVYLANSGEPGKFTEREVRLGGALGPDVEVISGVAQGEKVVSKGSFFVRAERERLGLRSGALASTTSLAQGPSGAGTAKASAQKARITVGEQGYEPSRVTFRSGAPARLTFVRITDRTCGTTVVFPSLDIRRELPLNQPVDIEFTPDKTGEIVFVCGMNMLRGTVVVD